MAKFRSHAAVIAAIIDSSRIGESKYRDARVLRFVFKHRWAHRKILQRLIDAQRRQQLARRGMPLKATVTCDRCGLKKKGLSAGNGHGPRCGSCSAFNEGGPNRRPIRIENPRELRRAMADAWAEAHPGRPFTGRQWRNARKAYSRAERAERAEARAKAMAA